MKGGIMSLKDGLCVCNFIQKEVIKAGVGFLKEVHNIVVALGHSRRHSTAGRGSVPTGSLMIGDGFRVTGSLAFIYAPPHSSPH